ncbi:Hsp20/alpha crystallin family protein [Streptomyces lavendulae]|uniref:Hsp20/alpha crystallin family protein n=1 Tax=Streptomyces lavendulae TaxID=1914 RepID=UPI0025534719|nr:Hsp20/alpha crystallin family protein [Streptomyces lavendulae]
MSEEEETEDAYVIKAEMPGIPRENIIVEMHGNDLWITGELDKRSDKVLAQRKGEIPPGCGSGWWSVRWGS